VKYKLWEPTKLADLSLLLLRVCYGIPSILDQFYNPVRAVSVSARLLFKEQLAVFQPKKVAQRVALWERRVMEERTSEIFKRLQKKQMEVAREAEEAEQKQEQLWREQGKGEEEETKHRHALEGTWCSLWQICQDWKQVLKSTIVDHCQ